MLHFILECFHFHFMVIVPLNTKSTSSFSFLVNWSVYIKSAVNLSSGVSVVTRCVTLLLATLAALIGQPVQAQAALLPC